MRHEKAVTKVLRQQAVLGVMLGAAGCATDEATPWVSPVPFDTATVTIEAGDVPARLLVEVARTPEQRSLGLGLRPTLEPGSGMIFLYDSIQPPDAGFWMWRTRFPLEIAFLDSAGTVLRVLEMEPCTAVYLQGCTTYEPGVPYWWALEVNRGWFEERGVGEGASVAVEEGAGD